MVLSTLRETWEMVRRFPLLFLFGLTTGIIVAIMLLIQLYGEGFFAERVIVLMLLGLPFLAGGTLQMVQKNQGTLSVLVEGGKKNYFRILLATLVFLFIGAITVFALIIPLNLLGFEIDTGILPFSLFGVFIPILYFTLFYDVAAVFEDRKVLDSLRRSVEFVTNRGFSVFLFILVNILILIGVTVALSILWSIVFTPQLETLAMNVTAGETVYPEMIAAALGPSGMGISTLFIAVWFTIMVTLFYVHKACFFRKYATGTAAPLIGEYDEKGRWYKY
jgi:hypothetical protein